MPLTVKLNDGKQIPAVGFGNMHGWENEYTQQAEDVPALALKHGFRHLDTAQVGAVWVWCGIIVDDRSTEQRTRLSARSKPPG